MNYGYAILPDVTCDLNSELRERFEVDGYVKGHITVPGGKEHFATPEWDFISAQDFYASLKSRKHGYTTAPGSAEEIAQCWESFLAQGKDVLALCISGALSVTYNLMLNTKTALLAKYPERKICVVDSRKYSLALGLLVVKACELRRQGLSVEDNAARLEEIKSTVHQMGFVDDLFFIASKGRLTQAKAFLGTLVGIKPMGDFDVNGLVTVLGKAKGYEMAYKAVVEYIKQTITDPQEQIIFVAQTAREKQAAAIIELLREQVKPKEIILSDVYCANGVNVGPGLLGVYYIGTPVTDLVHEGEIMKNIMDTLQ